MTPQRSEGTSWQRSAKEPDPKRGAHAAKSVAAREASTHIPFTTMNEPTPFEKTSPYTPPAAGKAESPPKPKKLGAFEKLMWWVLVFFCGVWLMNPVDPTDVLPVFNWLDEAAALFILVTALDRLGIEIPFLHKMLRNRAGVGSPEKDVTPKG